MVSALEALSGVSVASVNGDRLEVRLTTRIEPSQPPPPGLARLTCMHSLMNSPTMHSLMNSLTHSRTQTWEGLLALLQSLE